MTTALRLNASEHLDASLTRIGRALGLSDHILVGQGRTYVRTGTIGVRILHDDTTVEPGERLEAEILIYGHALTHVVQRTARLERCTAAEVAATARALAGHTEQPVIATVPNNLGEVEVCVRHEPWGEVAVDVRPAYTSGRWTPLSMMGGKFVVRER